MDRRLDRRAFLALGGSAAAGAALACTLPTPLPGSAERPLSWDQYSGYDALGLAELVASGQTSPAELLEIAIARTEAVNGTVNAVVTKLYDRARAEIARGLPEGPFRGVPFLVKDLGVHIAGTVTTNGCALFRDAVATNDSTLVRRYRAAGLVIFGRSATPEFGLTTTTESALFGATRNPWNRERIAGGSSGGAAAAVAAGIVPLAHASDGGGSIRIPASCCGLFGMKPTRMRVPLGPDRAEGWNGLSTVHAVSRSVRDSAALLDASGGPAPGDPYHAPPRARPYLDEVGESPGRLRIALMRAPLSGVPVHPECLRAVDDAAALCELLGHVVEEAAPSLDVEALGNALLATTSVSTALALEDRARALGRALRPDDVEPITWNLVQQAQQISGFDQARARAAIHRTSRAMAAFQRDYDAILSPTLAQPPLEIGRLSLSRPDWQGFFDDLTGFSPFTMIMNATGQPAMSVPLHWSADGLPVGVMFAGRFGDEASLYRLAGQLEAARPWAGRRPTRL